RASHAAFAIARAAHGAQFSGASAAGARHVEAHFPRGLLDRSGPAASGASLRRTNRASPVAGFAGLHARDRKFFHRTAHGVPEINLHLVFQVAARFLLRLHFAATAAPEKLAEQIAETSAASCRPCTRTAATAKIKSAKIKINARILIFAAVRG